MVFTLLRARLPSPAGVKGERAAEPHHVGSYGFCPRVWVVLPVWQEGVEGFTF